MSFYYGPTTTRVGLTMRTSQAQVIGAVQDYVRNSKGDTSAESYRAIFKERDGGKGYLDKGDLALFLRDADACAPKSAASVFAGPDCNATADKVISSMDKTGDGTVSWEEFRDAIHLDPIPYDDAPDAQESKDATPEGTAHSAYDKYSGFVRNRNLPVDSRIENLYLPEKRKVQKKPSESSKGDAAGSKDSSGASIGGIEITPMKVGLAVGIPLVLYLMMRKS